jgi:hypothetical protein
MKDQGPLERLKQFKTLGWYMIAGWATTCPECGVPRGGTPGYYWHLIRENTDDEARVREIHGDGED